MLRLKRLQEAVEKRGQTIREMLGISKDEARRTADVIGDSFGEAFEKLSQGSMSAKEAFRAMAQDIIKRLYQIFVVESLVSSISGAVSGFFGKTIGAPSVPPTGAAIGGSVQRGVPRLVGERGAEIFIPSSSGSIVSNKNLVGNGAPVINQTINISTGVSQTVRAEITQMLPQIQDAAKAAVVDARRRGGSFAGAFGG